MNVHKTSIDDLVSNEDRQAASLALGRLFLASSDAERSAIRECWDFGVSWPYPKLARLGCRKGETAPPRVRITSSLVLDMLEGVVGTREHLIALAAKYRSCELAGLSPSDVFESVAAVFPLAEARVLRGFLERSPSDRNLSAFLLVERVNDDGEIEIHLATT